MFLRLLSRRTRLIVRLVVAASAIGATSIVAGLAPATAAASCASQQAGTSGDVCSFTLTPSSTTAGGDPSITSSMTFAYPNLTDSVKSLSVTLPAGLFASLGAITTTCSVAELTSSPETCPPGSEIGTGTLTSTISSRLVLDVDLFMMPAPASTDAAGVGTYVYFDNIPVTTATGTVSTTTVDGNPALVLSIPQLPDSLGKLQIQLSSLSFTINGPAPTIVGTPSSTPFTRLPTSCATATSTLSVQTYSASTPNGSGSYSFTPTGCSSLAFAPSISATATRDTSDPGVTLVTTVTTNPAQAADKALTLLVPTGTVAPDVFNAGHLFNQVVGSATAITPLVTTPLGGTVTLTGSVSAPYLTITFPPPFSLSFSGAVNVVSNSVTFASVPDVPLNSLTLKLTGGPTSLFYTTCLQPKGTIQATFVGQNGVTTPTTAPIDVTGCPPPVVATVSGGTTAGLSSGSAKLGFALAAGSGGPKLTSFEVSLPSGLSFNRKTYKKGVILSGAKLSRTSVSGRQLSVTLRSAAASFSITLSPKALTESASLRTQIKRHKIKSLSATIVAKNSSGASVKLKLALKI